MLNNRVLLVLIAPAMMLVGCSSSKTVRVAVPPRVDLHAYPTVGLVGFSSNAGDDLERLTTQRFLQEVQAAQPGTRVVELGPEAEVLASTHRRSWDAAALRAVKQANGVDVLVIGRLDVTKSKPQVQLSSLFKSVKVRSDVKAALTARLLETGSGATMWTNSSQLSTTLANGSLSARGGSLGMRDAEEVYGKMVDNLVCAITDDFRVHYVTRTVPREQVQTASAGE